jgi:hypothetical protein
MKRLRGFDSTRCPIMVFLVTVGVQLWQQALRSQNSRRVDPLADLGNLVDQRLDPGAVMLEAEEFSATLPDKSSAFFRDQVLNGPDDGAVDKIPSEPGENSRGLKGDSAGNMEGSVSSENTRQMTKRLVERWKVFERGE